MVSVIRPALLDQQLAANGKELSRPTCQENKHGQPDDKQEVPVNGAEFDVEAKPLRSILAPCSRCRSAEGHQAANDVEPMQTGDQVEEAVGGIARQDITVGNQLLPRDELPDQENDGGETADGDPLERYSHGVVLSSEQVQRGALFTMKLAEFEKGAEGDWGLSPKYVPPLLRVGTSPFLRESLDALGEALALFQEKLQENIAASYLGGEGLSGAKTCLKALYTFQRLLVDLAGQVHVHPYTLSEALKVFYAEVCVYQDRTPEDITSPYRHDDLAGTLGGVIKPLLEHLRLQKGKAPYVPFEQRDGMFSLEELPAEARAAKEVFLLLQKPRVGEALSIEALKLAGRMRVATVHKLSLVGIPVVRIERPPFQHSFGPEVDFFQLSFGEEWDLALREGSLAFYQTPGLAEAKAFLFWRRS